MQTIMFTRARSELAGLLDQVAQDRAPVEIVRRDKPSAVLIDKVEYEALIETVHLLSSPANGERLMRSIEAAERGAVIDRDPTAG